MYDNFSPLFYTIFFTLSFWHSLSTLQTKSFSETKAFAFDAPYKYMFLQPT